MKELNKSGLVNVIANKLSSKRIELRKMFVDSSRIVGVRHCFVDDLLPNKIAYELANAFPIHTEMRHMKSFREKKYTSKSFDKFNPILKDMTFAMQEESVIKIVNEITGIEGQEADPSLYAGGLSMMPLGCYLNPHIDNSHDGPRKKYRTLNLLYYATRGWEESFDGNLELWDKKVKNRVTIHSKFNRLVLMETNPWSWHSVSEVKVDLSRNCISNYYFSYKSPIGKDYFNVTSYSARPEDWTKSLLFKSDNLIRSGLRLVFPNGLGKKDIYNSGKKI